MSDIRGQIGLVHTNGIPARIIQFVTRSHWNHVVIGVSSTTCIGAEPGGVRIRPISDFPEVVWADAPYTPTQRLKVLAYVLLQRGVRYNWADDILIGLTLILKSHAPRWMLREVSDTDSFQCSQLAAAALSAAGVHVFDDDRPAGAVYPASYVPWFRDAGWLTSTDPS